MISILSIVGGAIGLLVLWGLVSFAQNAFKLRKFNGPVALPLIGNLYDTRAVRFISFIGVLARQYGKYFVFWSGNKPMIVISDPQAVRQILTDNRNFIKGADYTSKFKEAFGEGLVTSNGDKHKHDRTCLGKYFIRSNIEQYLGMISSQTTQMIEEVVEPNAGKSLDMQHFFHVLALRIFAKFAVSHDFSAPDQHKTAERINEIVCWASNVVGEHIVLNIPMWSIVPRVEKFRKYMRELDSYFEPIMDARILASERGDDVPDDCLTALLEDNQSHTEILDHLRTLLCAGHDTTAYFGCYMLHLLAQNPEVQEKLREEIVRVMNGRMEVTQEDINEMKYCKMVQQETLRIYTVIPFVNRVASKETKIKETEHVIPKDSTVLIPLGLMNRDPEVWENPSEFRPERFEGIVGHTSAKHGYFPFAYGPRTCVGNTLALMENAVMFAQLLQRYRFVPEPGFKPHVIGGISLVSKNGVVVKIEQL